MQQDSMITNLAIAGLISEGEFDIFSDVPVLKMPLHRKKTSYLRSIITESHLEDYIDVDINRGQISIHSHTCLANLKDQWYDEKKKIFSKYVDPNNLSLDSVLMAITLFGIRKLETIYIPTSVEKDYIIRLVYCVEHHLNVPVIPGANHIKIARVKQVILSNYADIPAIHSAELINLLTKKEKRRLLEEGDRI